VADQVLDPIAAKYGGVAVAPEASAVDPIAAKFGGVPASERPPPVQVDRQFTSDVSVTPAVGMRTRLGSAKSGGAATEPPFGEGVIDTPAVGVAQAAQGVKGLSRYYSQPTTSTLNAASDVLEGTMKAGSPLVLAGALVDLPATLIGVATATAASAAAGKVAGAAGASPELQRFLSALTAAATAVVGSREVLESAKQGTSSMVRALALAGQLSGRTLGAERPVARAGTVAEAVAPAVRPTAHAPSEVIEAGGIPSMPQSDVGETLGELVSTVAAPEQPPLEVGGRDRMVPTQNAPVVDPIAARLGGVPLTDEAGRSLGPNAYAGPERRAANQGPPAGVDERRLLPAEQVRQDLGEAARARVTAPPAVDQPTAATEVAGGGNAPREQLAAGVSGARPPREQLDEDVRGAQVAAPERAESGTTVDPIAAKHGGVPVASTAGATSAILKGSDDATETPAATPGSLPADDAAERAPVASGGLQPGGVDSRGAGARRRSAAARVLERRADEHAHLQALVDRAVADGYAHDPVALHTELRDRLALLKELDAARADDGRDPETLLRAIATGGGISIDQESAQKGEIAWLKEAQDTRPARARAGQQLRPRGNLRPNPVRSGYVRGIGGVFRTDGLSLDGMVEYLSQDPRFTHLTSINDLTAAIGDAATASAPIEAVRQLVAGLGPRWWQHIGHPPAEPIREDEAHDSVEPDEGDTSFDVNAFGEEQSRLPTAGAVRDRDVATPTFEAPFSLTGGADTTPQEREADLFARDLASLRGGDDTEPSFMRVIPFARGAASERMTAKQLHDAYLDLQMKIESAKIAGRTITDEDRRSLDDLKRRVDYARDVYMRGGDDTEPSFARARPFTGQWDRAAPSADVAARRRDEPGAEAGGADAARHALRHRRGRRAPGGAGRAGRTAARARRRRAHPHRHRRRRARGARHGVIAL
jgi:hypothetical protein